MTPPSRQAARVTLPTHVQWSTSSPAQRGAERGVPQGGEVLAKGTAVCLHRTGTDLHLSFPSSRWGPGVPAVERGERDRWRGGGSGDQIF